MKTVIVTGGREYSDRSKVRSILNFINPDVVIQGGATGADRLAKLWAKANGKKWFTIDAEWTKHGLAAGPIRNREMLQKYPEAFVIAFPGGSGTENCIKTAQSFKMFVLQVR